MNPYLFWFLVAWSVSTTVVIIALLSHIASRIDVMDFYIKNIHHDIHKPNLP